MRGALWIGSLAVGLLACGSKHPAGLGGDGMLVLEVGGEHSSLRAALLAAGQQLPPAQPLRLPAPEAEAEPQPESAAAAAAEAAPASDSGSNAAAPAAGAAVIDSARHGASAGAAVPTAQWFVVTLGPGQTPIHLAKKYLGDGNRFREILELNGWTDADTRRLQTGTRVKIPREAAARR